MDSLSLAAKSMWAKKSDDGELLWLPLVVHMMDSAVTARNLWDSWLPGGTKEAISAGVGEIDLTKKLLIFLAAAHDIGKATPVFQAKQARPLCPELDARINEKLTLAGVPIKQYILFHDAKLTPHALATQAILTRAGCNKNASFILGTHHGKPINISTFQSSGIGAYGFNYHLEEEGKTVWTAVQEEMIAFALKLAGFSSVTDLPSPNMVAQVLLSGLLIMTDWIASNVDYYPYIRIEDSYGGLNLETRERAGWDLLDLSSPWVVENEWAKADLYKVRFNHHEPREIQSAILKTVKEILSPGMVILEAPMGGGKTEAALVAAEVFADISQRSGVFFALPTQATADGIFPRLLRWIGTLEKACNHSIMLAHGKAEFNKEYEGLRIPTGSKQIAVDNDSGVVVREWFEGKKKSLLADFVVGTIDQLLLAALKHKHVMLRHLGLANKVVIIDECHAYDAYMSRYLYMALRWLGAYGVPVIILSATLPAEKRRKLILAYLNQELKPPANPDPLGRDPKVSAKPQPEWMNSRSYPLITYTDGCEVKHIAVDTNPSESYSVSISPLDEEALIPKLEDLLSDGGCVGIIVNTVQRAQELANQLREHFGQDVVRLLHSRFLAPHRIAKEQEILKELGKPGENPYRPQNRIVVGTQVLEQSLDIDFDLLITDLCPMDLLLQRIGRLHRHLRPERHRLSKLTLPMCLVMGMKEEEFEPGARDVYGDYLLMRTKCLLPKQITLPTDIPDLVQNAYDETVPLNPEPLGYQKAKRNWDTHIQTKESRSEVFSVGPPWLDKDDDIAGWLDKDVSDQRGCATVRDTDESIEVLLIQEIEGKLGFLGWTGDFIELFPDRVPESIVAKNLARQRILLPRALSGPWIIKKTITELEDLNETRLFAWQESPWLKGELFLIMDEQLTCHLCGFKLAYDNDVGLSFEKEVEEDVRGKGI